MEEQKSFFTANKTVLTAAAGILILTAAILMSRWFASAVSEDKTSAGNINLMEVRKSFDDFKNSEASGRHRYVKVVDLPAGAEIISAQILVTEKFESGAPLQNFAFVAGIPQTGECVNATAFTKSGNGAVNPEVTAEVQNAASNLLCGPDRPVGAFIRADKDFAAEMKKGAMRIFVSYIVHK